MCDWWTFSSQCAYAATLPQACTSKPCSTPGVSSTSSTVVAQNPISSVHNLHSQAFRNRDCGGTVDDRRTERWTTKSWSSLSGRRSSRKTSWRGWRGSREEKRTGSCEEGSSFRTETLPRRANPNTSPDPSPNPDSSDLTRRYYVPTSSTCVVQKHGQPTSAPRKLMFRIFGRS